LEAIAKVDIPIGIRYFPRGATGFEFLFGEREEGIAEQFAGSRVDETKTSRQSGTLCVLAKQQGVC
jgi:hypothetical protein